MFGSISKPRSSSIPRSSPIAPQRFPEDSPFHNPPARNNRSNSWSSSIFARPLLLAAKKTPLAKRAVAVAGLPAGTPASGAVSSAQSFLPPQLPLEQAAYIESPAAMYLRVGTPGGDSKAMRAAFSNLGAAAKQTLIRTENFALIEKEAEYWAMKNGKPMPRDDEAPSVKRRIDFGDEPVSFKKPRLEVPSFDAPASQSQQPPPIVLSAEMSAEMSAELSAAQSAGEKQPSDALAADLPKAAPVAARPLLLVRPPLLSQRQAPATPHTPVNLAQAAEQGGLLRILPRS